MYVDRRVILAGACLKQLAKNGRDYQYETSSMFNAVTLNFKFILIFIDTGSAI